MSADDPELAAALAAVASGPADDGAKRVLADLLLERGDARGEFLLLQFLVADNQASSALRSRAEQLFRIHKREWMAGAERALCNLRLERGFPVEAELTFDASKHLEEALRSPMMSTLRSLSSCLVYGRDPDLAIVDAVCSPRLRHLRALTLRNGAELRALAQRDVALPIETLTISRRGGITPEDCALVTTARAFSALRTFVFPTPPEESRNRRWPSPPERLQPLERWVKALSGRGTLESVIVSNELAGEPRRFVELAALWPALPFKHLQVGGTFELRREESGTAVSLQNLDVEQLLDLKAQLPADTVRLSLAPRFRERLSEKARLAQAFAAFSPVIVP